MRAGRPAFFALLGLLAILVGCGGEAERTDGEEQGRATSEEAAQATEPEGPTPDETAFNEARAVEDPAAREAALLSWLQTFPESEHRAQAHYRIWRLKREADPASARTWAVAALEEEPSADGKGQLYWSLFTLAVEEEDRDEGLRLAREFWDAGLVTPRYLNAVAWSLVDEPAWDPKLGAQMAEKAAENAEGMEKAMFLDTAGWGNYKIGNHQMAAVQLEAALNALDEPEAEVSEHLEQIYQALGDEEKLLALYNYQLEFRVDKEMEARAEALAEAMGHDVSLYRSKLWEKRQIRSAPAADFALKDLDGNTHRLADYRGKVVLINFWHPT